MFSFTKYSQNFWLTGNWMTLKMLFATSENFKSSNCLFDRDTKQYLGTDRKSLLLSFSVFPWHFLCFWIAHQTINTNPMKPTYELITLNYIFRCLGHEALEKKETNVLSAQVISCCVYDKKICSTCMATCLTVGLIQLFF